jgi:glycerophosphoryl diester phosphodiesterase
VRRPLVIAHRGGAALAPENTLAACARALRLGVDAVEIDVRLTADGHPVVLHDATLDRTTSGRGQVAALPATALQALDATVGWRGASLGREPPPLLSAVGALLAGRVALHVELKGEPRVPVPLVERVVALLAEAHPTPTLLSFDWQALELAGRLAPALVQEALLRDWPADAPEVLSTLASRGVAWLGLRYAVLTPRRAAMVRAAGLRLNVWTPNRRPSLRRARALGVDAITTDRPDRLLELLAQECTTA